jgi:DNA repair protein RadA/Sms
VLLGGDPGIGKSTLLLQVAQAMAGHCSVLYVSAEESAQQVRLRWRRLVTPSLQEKTSASANRLPREEPPSSGGGLQLLAETDLDRVLEELEALRPAVAVVDSIQALHDPNLSSAPGTVAQVRECAAALQRLAKHHGVALVLVGHVTKEGVLAGPKVLEHLVDAVLTFEGDRFASHRLLRAAKNRFGATYELGVFEMRDGGLAQVTNPSELFLGGGEPSSGTATIVAFEGTRPLVVELQALVSTTSYASPRRTATGIGTNRLHQILAVIEKHLGLPLSRFDCYLAVAGGLQVDEPAGDLGVAAAVVASYRDLILPPGTVLIGELGLGGQLRPVGQLEQRLQEAGRFHITRQPVQLLRQEPEGMALTLRQRIVHRPGDGRHKQCVVRLVRQRHAFEQAEGITPKCGGRKSPRAALERIDEAQQQRASLGQLLPPQRLRQQHRCRIMHRAIHPWHRGQQQVTQHGLGLLSLPCINER